MALSVNNRRAYGWASDFSNISQVPSEDTARIGDSRVLRVVKQQRSQTGHKEEIQIEKTNNTSKWSRLKNLISKKGSEENVDGRQQKEGSDDEEKKSNFSAGILKKIFGSSKKDYEKNSVKSQKIDDDNSPSREIPQPSSVLVAEYDPAKASTIRLKSNSFIDRDRPRNHTPESPKNHFTAPNDKNEMCNIKSVGSMSVGQLFFTDRGKLWGSTKM